MAAKKKTKRKTKKKKGATPTNPALYARVKAEAKRKFKVYPSAYANGWLVRTYKKRGGGYRQFSMARKKKKKDPKVGTGKKPKGSGRRLYTDENPKDTVKIKFATTADAKATVAKVKRSKKPFARKIQILTVGEQRAKVMGKTQVVSIFKKGKNSIRKTRKK